MSGLSWVLLLLVGIAAACDPAAPVVDPEVLPQLPEGVYALAGISPDLETSDLEPLEDLMGSAAFVGLGESLHTSGGFNQAKVRLIQHMVKQLGFRALAFESPWLEARETAEYVANCTGSPEKALGALLPVWRGAHIRDLLRWLCEYNAAHPSDPVIFFGMDIQEPWRSAPALEAFLIQADPHVGVDAERLADSLFECFGATYQGDNFYASAEFAAHVRGDQDQAGHEACMTGLSEMEGWLTANAALLETATSARSVEEARLSLVALRAWEEQVWVPWPEGYQSREEGMAELLLGVRALDAPGRKVIVWAANWHLAKRYEEVRGYNDDPDAVVRGQGARSTGSILHETLSEEYVAIGLIGYRVNVAIGQQPPVADHPASVEARLHGLGWPWLFVSLRHPLSDDLLPAGGVYQISQEWGNPYHQFDGLVFLDESPAMTIVAVPTNEQR